MFRKPLIILMMSLIFSATVVCSITGSQPEDEAELAEVEATATQTPEPTQPPVEEDIEIVRTPTNTPVPDPTDTPIPEPTATPTSPAAGPLTAQEAYDLMVVEAQAWQEDAVLNEMQTTTLGPLQADGTSESWTATFWSPAAGKLNTLIMINGQIQGGAVDVPNEQRIINDLDQVIFETQAIYNTAAESGGQAYLEAGYVALSSLTSYPLDLSVPTWYVNFHNAQSFTVAHTVIIDARSGEVIQAISIAEP